MVIPMISLPQVPLLRGMFSHGAHSQLCAAHNSSFLEFSASPYGQIIAHYFAMYFVPLRLKMVLGRILRCRLRRLKRLLCLPEVVACCAMTSHAYFTNPPLHADTLPVGRYRG